MSPTVQNVNFRKLLKSLVNHTPMGAFLSDSFHPPTGILCASNSAKFCCATRSFACTSSQGTSVYRSGAGTAFGSPLGPKILTSARAALSAQIHLFRRFAKKNQKMLSGNYSSSNGSGKVRQPFSGPCCQLLLYLMSAVRLIFSWPGKSEHT